MATDLKISESSRRPSAWVRRFLPLIEPGGLVLDLAAGSGRHARLLRRVGYSVCAVDCDVSALCRSPERDAWSCRSISRPAHPWPLSGRYDGVVVTNYLHRPLFPAIGQALAPGGVAIYETFALGTERFGHPQNPDFLLRPGEFLDVFAMLTVVAFEQGEVIAPRPAVIQRIPASPGHSVGCRHPPAWTPADQESSLAICRSPLIT